MKTSSRFTNSFLIVLLVCWTGVIIAADYVLCDVTVRQYLALGYKQTPCKIVHSEVPGNALGHAGIRIHFSYTVNGKRYEGLNYRYDDGTANLSGPAIVLKYPVGSFSTAYYNPEHPADSVLSPGIGGCDLLILLFALPVNILTYSLWLGLMSRFREKWRMPEAGGVSILKQSGQIRIRLASMSAPAAGLYGLGLAAFFSSFPAVVLYGFSPSLQFVALIWGAVLMTGVGAFFWKSFQNNSGQYDLLINTRSNTVTLPRNAGRSATVTLPQQGIAAISLQRRASKSASGFYYSYLPALHPAGPGPGQPSKPEKLTDWGWREEKALAFCEWLGEQLDIQFKGIEDEARETAPS